MLKIAIAGVLSAALIILTPHTQAAPPNINNAVRNTNVHAVQVEAPRKEPTAELVSQEKTPTDPQPISQTVESNNGCSQYRYLVEQYDWNVQTAMAICMAESGGNERAFSQTCDRGLMQVNCIHADMVSGNLDVLYDPATNISVAYKIYSARGWSAWSTYLSGVYLKYE